MGVCCLFAVSLISKVKEALHRTRLFYARHELCS